MSLTTLPAGHLVQHLAEGGVTAEALTGQFLDAIRRQNGSLNAFLHVDEQGAVEQARSIDARRKRGEKLGPLAGLPVAVKDVICTSGITTTAGSKILEHFRPPYDAHVVERLKAADAVLIGKTNCDEFAMGSSNENSAYGPARNPWDTERIPGGSSGGSAAAVAACLAPLALGTDTGGSVRQPASLCGVVGLKPSYGRVSRYGLIAYGSSLDQVGPISHDVAGSARMLEVIAGHDPRDATSADHPVPRYLQRLDEPLTPLTIGVPREYFAEGLDADVEKSVREALRVYQSLGATLREVSLPHSKYALATYYLVATAEASSNLARYDGVHFGHRTTTPQGLIDMVSQSRDEGFGAEVKRRVMLGCYALSSGYRDAYYLKALKVRRMIHDDFDRLFAECDVIAGPTSPTVAFRIGERSSDPLAMYLADIYTISANLAGLCGISVPCGFSTGLPVGLQLLGAPLEEEKLLRAARMYEQATDWHKRHPMS